MRGQKQQSKMLEKEEKEIVCSSPLTGSSDTPSPPPPPYSGMPFSVQKADKKMRLQYLFLAIIIIGIITYFGSQALADLMQEQVEGDVALKNTIIGSWVLYKDNSGVGSYVQANADGTIKLTEVRLGEWMITPHRLVEEEDISFLEFYDEATESWVRFIMITTVNNKELLLTYLE